MDFSLLLYSIPVLLVGFLVWAQISPIIERKKYNEFRCKFKDLNSEKLYIENVKSIKSLGSELKILKINLSNRDSTFNMLETAMEKAKTLPQFLTEMHKFDLKSINDIVDYASSLLEIMKRSERINNEECLTGSVSGINHFGQFCIEVIDKIDKSIQKNR